MANEKGSGYKWYVLAVLTVVYTFNFIDRQILVILQEPIKAELGLSDTQLGLLTGLAFAALYVVLGIPIARYADLNNRKNVVTVSLAVWSAMTALSGAVTNFTQLLLTRIGVGVGEAGGSPPSHSIISDYFPPEKRATALSIYSMGVYFGILMGFVAGGLIARAYGWRVAFYAMGIPGVLFSLVLYFTVKEPVKGRFDKKANRKSSQEKEDLDSIAETTSAEETEAAPSLGSVIKILLKKKTLVYLALGSGFHTFITYGVGNWFPSFVQRVHGIDIAQAGIVLGITTGIGGAIGTFLGGYLGDKYRHVDIRWYLWIPIIAGIINFVPSIVLFFSGNGQLVLWLTFVTSLLTAVYLGPTIAIIHNLVDAKMRAFASAILFFVLNLIGLGLGPLVIGWVSDLLTPTYGDLSLRYAFLTSFVAGIISLTLFIMASRSLKTDMENMTN